MKLKKTLKIVLGLIGILVLLVIFTVLFWLGPTVKLVAEKIGTKALGTPLTIDMLSINPRKGTIHLSDFSIANPDTFGKSNAVSLVSMDVAIDIGSIFSQTIMVHQVTLNSPHFIYEQSSASDNINEFILNIHTFAGFDPDAPPEPPTQKELEKKRKKAAEKAREKKGQEPKVVVVESLVINDVLFHLANTDNDLLDFGMGFEKLSVSMTNGIVQLDNFYVSNPNRLETPNLFSVEQFQILLEPYSIYSSNITVNAINIRKPHAFVEHNPETDTIGEFLKIATGLVTKIPTYLPKATVVNEAEISAAEPAPPAKDIILGPITIDDLQFHAVNMGDPELSIHLGLNQLTAALEQGSIRLEQLFLTNPSRLDAPNLFSLDGIDIDFEPDSIESDRLVLKDIQIKKPYLFLELNKEANTVNELIKVANRFIERLPTYQIPEIPQAASGTVGETPATNESTTPPVELHNLLIDDIQVRLLDTTPTNAVPSESHMLAGISEVSIKLVEGKLQIKDITIPNAKGFLATNLVHLAGIDISIQPDSLFADQVIIDTIFIDSPEVNLEQTQESGNVVALQTQLMQFAPPAAEKPAEKNVAAPTPEEPLEKPDPIPLAEQPVVLHQLQITNLFITLNLPMIATNETEGVFEGTIGMLNPMDKISFNKLNKLNPLSETADEEEVDPNAPLTLIAFEQLSLEPLKGLLHINELRISNPPDFSRRDLVNITEFRIDIDPDSIQSDTLLIEDILVARPRIRYERHIMIDNFKSLQREIEQATVRRQDMLQKKDKEHEVAAGENEEDKQKVIIEHILIDNGMVRAKLSALPAIPVPLPDIELNDIGKKKGGTSAAEASTEVFDTFYESMVGAVGNATGFAGDAVKGVGSFGKGALSTVTGGVIGGAKSKNKDTTPAVKETDEKTKEK